MILQPPQRLQAALLAATIAFWSACVASPSAAPAGHSTSLPRVDADMALSVQLERDTVRVSDGGPLEVRYYVVNGPDALEFENDPTHYNISIEVQSPEGRSLTHRFPTHAADGTYGPTRILLPARAVLEQVLNLRCIADGAGYWADPIGKPARCLGGYSFRGRGTYRIIIEYVGPKFQWERRSDVAMKADPDTREFILNALPDARRMVDTAILVVE